MQRRGQAPAGVAPSPSRLRGWIPARPTAQGNVRWPSFSQPRVAQEHTTRVTNTRGVLGRTDLTLRRSVDTLYFPTQSNARLWATSNNQAMTGAEQHEHRTEDSHRR